MNKFFLYKLTIDNGGAPCVTPDLLTLAICKPMVRSAADLRDWIFGFMDNPGENKLIYIAEVTGKMVGGAYYGTKAFESRRDCIYNWTAGNRLELKCNPRFHGEDDDRKKDLGAHPDYRNANVLMSTNFRYFGSVKCKVQVPRNVTAYIKSIGEGHRSAALQPFKPTLRTFLDAVWDTYSTKKKLGQPLHPGNHTKCHGGHYKTC